VPVIEVSHGDGLGGSSLQYGFSLVDELELIAAAKDVCARAQIAVLLLPGVGTRSELRDAARCGAGIVRIATQCTEADVSEQHFGLSKELGLETVGFLMMAHMRPPEVLAEQAARMERYGADCVYIVDSAGAMLPAVPPPACARSPPASAARSAFTRTTTSGSPSATASPPWKRARNRSTDASAASAPAPATPPPSSSPPSSTSSDSTPDSMS
jgi:hypothetical protein